MIEGPIGSIKIPAGYGPRHLCSGPDGWWLWCELQSRLLQIAGSVEQGFRITADHDLNRLPGAGDLKAGSAIHLHPNGRWLVIATREQAGVMILEPTTSGLPRLRGLLTLGQAMPRDVRISRNGQWLLVADQTGHQGEQLSPWLGRQHCRNTDLPDYGWITQLSGACGLNLPLHNGRMFERQRQFFCELHAADYEQMASDVQRLDFAELWQPLPDGVSVANLVSHVCEMETFWIDHGLCHDELPARNRQHEFDRHGDQTAEQLVDRLQQRQVRTRERLMDSERRKDGHRI